jgi:hypothetical protein
MADQIKEEPNLPNDENKASKDGDGNTVERARRRVLKAGLATVPVILTLRGRPLFGKTPTPSITASIAASRAKKY